MVWLLYPRYFLWFYCLLTPDIGSTHPRILTQTVFPSRFYSSLAECVSTELNSEKQAVEEIPNIRGFETSITGSLATLTRVHGEEKWELQTISDMIHGQRNDVLCCFLTGWWWPWMQTMPLRWILMRMKRRTVKMYVVWSHMYKCLNSCMEVGVTWYMDTNLCYS